MDFGDLAKDNTVLLQLFGVIGKYDKCVGIDFLHSSCTGEERIFTINLFDQVLNSQIIKGMNQIVEIGMPNNALTIKADKNGKSPFFIFPNLTSFDFQDVEIIEDFAFDSIKKLKSTRYNYDMLYMRKVKSVGNNAFRGCENLSFVTFQNKKVETIGDFAFCNCDTLQYISFYYSPPPDLGESAFLGTTPGNFIIRCEYLKPYETWLLNNASKFNNDAKDIVIHYF